MLKFLSLALTTMSLQGCIFYTQPLCENSLVEFSGMASAIYIQLGGTTPLPIVHESFGHYRVDMKNRDGSLAPISYATCHISNLDYLEASAPGEALNLPEARIYSLALVEWRKIVIKQKQYRSLISRTLKFDLDDVKALGFPYLFAPGNKEIFIVENNLLADPFSVLSALKINDLTPLNQPSGFYIAE